MESQFRAIRNLISAIISDGLLDDQPIDRVTAITNRMDDAMASVRIAEIYWEECWPAARCRIFAELTRAKAIYNDIVQSL